MRKIPLSVIIIETNEKEGRSKRMNVKSFMLGLILTASIGSFILFAYGFAIGINDVTNPKADESLTKKEKEPIPQARKSDQILHIVSLGDSLTRGVGDDSGRGYVTRVVDSLKKSNKKEVAATNLAVSGAKMGDLTKQLQTTGAQYALKQADMIMLTIGGNDLNPKSETAAKDFHPDLRQLTIKATEIVTEIRKLNADAPIFWLGLYYPYENITELKGASKVLIEWNAILDEIALKYKNITIIPVYDLFKGKTNKLLYTDRFHPNEAGYELMANRVLQTVNAEMKFSGKKEVMK